MPETLQHAYGAKLGDRGSLEYLFDAHADKLRRYLRTHATDEHAAEDAAQEAWVKVAREIGSFDPAKGKFQSWLFHIGRNALKDMHKSAYSRKVTLSADMIDHDTASTDDTEEVVARRVAYNQACAAIKTLPKKQREVMIHRFHTGLTIAETADLMSTTETAVKANQRRACESLAKSLGGRADALVTLTTTTTVANPDTRSMEAPA